MNKWQFNIAQYRPLGSLTRLIPLPSLTPFAGPLVLVWGLLLVGCNGLTRSPVPVSIEADHGTQHYETNAKTVRELLAEAGITLGELDRVNPDLTRSIVPGMTVRVIRVTEETETEIIPLPFERRIVVNEALAPGEQRLAQLGQSGQEEIVTKITFENGVEVSRVQVSKTVVQEPTEEVLVVGAKQSASSIPIDGIVAYLSGGNAWIMKDSNATRHPVTTAGDLDGRVFNLAPDGGKLLYTRTVTEVVDAPLNELWMIDTRIVGEAPISLPVKGVLYASWSPSLSESVIAYSTAERVPSQPGWRANNDLWLWNLREEIDEAVEIVPPNTGGLYAWWGTTYAWSPDGKSFAYANAGQVGVIDILSKTMVTLVEFAPFETNSNWVWVPTLSWSPNSQFIATVIHGPPLQDESPEASPVFDLWLLGAGGDLKVKVWEQAGMWSNPIWHDQGIAFGRATNPLRSIDSRYKLATIDWDGSNPQLLFPQTEAPGVVLPEMAWTPRKNEKSFVFVHQNNLFLYQGEAIPPQPLTSDGQSHRPEWALPVNLTTQLTKTNPVTQAISQTNSITVATPISVTTSITAQTTFEGMEP